MKELRLALALFLSIGLRSAWAAANFTVTQSGNANDGATFGNTSPGVAGTDFPTTGDWISQKPGFNVTIPNGYSVSLSSWGIHGGGTGTVARSSVTLYGSASLTMTGVMTMGFSGSGSVALILNAGTTFSHGSNNVVMGAGLTSYDVFPFLGTSSSHVVVNATGGAFTQGAQGGTNYVDKNWTYVDFNGEGNWGLGYLGPSANHQVSYMTWVNSGRYTMEAILNTSLPQNRYLEYSDFRGNVNTSSITARIASNSTLGYPTGRNDISNCTFDYPLSTVNIEFDVQAASVAFVNTIFRNAFVTASTAFGIDTSYTNFAVISTQNVSGMAQIVYLGSSTANGLVSISTADNTHFWQMSSASYGSTMTFTNVYVEVGKATSIVNDGDIFNGPTTQTSSGTVNHVIVNCLAECAELASYDGGANNTTFAPFRNNTTFMHTTGTTDHFHYRVGETYAGRTAMLPEIRNNLAVNDTADTSCSIVGDITSGTGGPDKVSTAAFNGSFNCNGTKYVVERSTGTPAYGASDIVANPHFIDSSRTAATWAATMGLPGTLGDAVGCLMRTNGYGGAATANCTIANLLSYEKYGFQPQNQIYARAGYDGSDIGAVTIIPGDM